MARYEREFKGSFSHFVKFVETNVVQKSLSAHMEDSTDYTMGDVFISVRVFERYSALGNNRVSLNVTIVSRAEDIFVSAIPSGGSQAVVMKLNTFGEESFLNKFQKEIELYIKNNNIR